MVSRRSPRALVLEIAPEMIDVAFIHAAAHFARAWPSIFRCVGAAATAGANSAENSDDGR
jgi:hypothetical protein